MKIEDHFKEIDAITEKQALIIAADGTERHAEERLIHEHFLEVSVNSYNAFRLSCTAEHLHELNPEKTFAVCSYVPDEQARKMVRSIFPYFRDKYCNEIYENLPERK